MKNKKKIINTIPANMNNERLRKNKNGNLKTKTRIKNNKHE